MLIWSNNEITENKPYTPLDVAAIKERLNGLQVFNNNPKFILLDDALRPFSVIMNQSLLCEKLVVNDLQEITVADLIFDHIKQGTSELFFLQFSHEQYLDTQGYHILLCSIIPAEKLFANVNLKLVKISQSETVKEVKPIDWFEINKQSSKY